MQNELSNLAIDSSKLPIASFDFNSTSFPQGRRRGRWERGSYSESGGCNKVRRMKIVTWMRTEQLSSFVTVRLLRLVAILSYGSSLPYRSSSSICSPSFLVFFRLSLAPSFSSCSLS